MIDKRIHRIRKILLPLLLAFVMVATNIIPATHSQFNAVAYAQTTVSTTTTVSEFVNTLTQRMTDRETTFAIRYVHDSTDTTANVQYIINNLETTLFKQAYSVNDYLKWSWTNLNVNVIGNDGDATFTFTIVYLTTKEQEAQIDVRVDSILNTILNGLETDKQKIRAINDWIIDNVVYDMSLVKKSAYNALFDGTTVCQGYSLLMYKMFSKIGITNKIVDGYINRGVDYHAWNLVNLDGNWYHVDTTNGDVLNNKNILFMLTDTELSVLGFTWTVADFPSASVTYVEPPVITIGEYEKNPTNKDIVVTATTNKGSLNKSSYTFIENGSFTFIATDDSGNVTEKTVTVTNIDKTAPVITVADNALQVVSGSAITFTATTNEGTLNETAHIFTTNGSFTFVATDIAGNITNYVVVVTSIVDTTPTVLTTPTESIVPITSTEPTVPTVPTEAMVPVTPTVPTPSTDGGGFSGGGFSGGGFSGGGFSGGGFSGGGGFGGGSFGGDITIEADIETENVDDTTPAIDKAIVEQTTVIVTEAKKKMDVRSVTEAQKAIDSMPISLDKIVLQEQLNNIVETIEIKAETAVDNAEKNRTASSIKKAQVAINNIVDAEKKEEMQKELEAIIAVVDKKNISNAKKVLATVKKQKTVANITKAQNAIDKMINSSQKEEMKKQLDVVIAVVDKKNIVRAKKALATVVKKQTVANITKAQKEIEKMIDSSQKEEMLKQLESLQNQLDTTVK